MRTKTCCKASLSRRCNGHPTKWAWQDVEHVVISGTRLAEIHFAAHVADQDDGFVHDDFVPSWAANSPDSYESWVRRHGRKPLTGHERGLLSPAQALLIRALRLGFKPPQFKPLLAVARRVGYRFMLRGDGRDAESFLSWLADAEQLAGGVFEGSEPYWRLCRLAKGRGLKRVLSDYGEYYDDSTFV
jgi:hypothetical protein